MAENWQSSYTSAEVAYPSKVVVNEPVMKMLRQKVLLPVHIQLCPTNRCNLSCSFCSCKDREKRVDLGIDRVKKFFTQFNTIQAVTLTGGGEPLMYKEFPELVRFLSGGNIALGLVTNGLLLHRVSSVDIKRFKWVRISLSDISLETGIFDVLKEFPVDKGVDVGLSLVCGDKFKTAAVLREAVKQCGEFVTHIRVVSDICRVVDEQAGDQIKSLKEELGDSFCSVYRDQVIFQGRNDFCHGHKFCRIGMVKPLITAEGNIQPCCGTQYSIKDNKDRDFNATFNLGTIEQAKEVFAKGYFDGSVCDVCYYCAYNQFFQTFFTPPVHGEFI